MLTGQPSNKYRPECNSPACFRSCRSFAVPQFRVLPEKATDPSVHGSFWKLASNSSMWFESYFLGVFVLRCSAQWCVADWLFAGLTLASIGGTDRMAAVTGDSGEHAAGFIRFTAQAVLLPRTRSFLLQWWPCKPWERSILINETSPQSTDTVELVLVRSLSLGKFSDSYSRKWEKKKEREYMISIVHM